MLLIKVYYNRVVGFLYALITVIKVVQGEIRYNTERTCGKQTRSKAARIRYYVEYDDNT